MTDHTFPSPFHLPEGRVLRGFVPPHFELFYRSTLRFRSGSRLSTVAVAASYAAWAQRSDAPALSLRDTARAMAAIGHSKRHSNGMFFADVALASDVPDLADNYPAPLAAAAALPVLQRIDALAAELADIRAMVGAA